MPKRGQTACSHPRVERCGRVSLRDALMFRLGKYPWTCCTCGSRLYYEERRPSDRGGVIRSSKGAPVGPVTPASQS